LLVILKKSESKQTKPAFILSDITSKITSEMPVNLTSCQSISVGEKQEVQPNDMEVLTALNASLKPYTNFNSTMYKALIREIKHVLKVFFFKAFSPPA
jgi:hypothetical protein